MMADKSMDESETLLSYLLKAAPPNRISTDASPHTLHPFASSSPDDPRSLLKSLLDATSVLSRNLQSYSSFSASEHKSISILRQSTSLIENLHTSQQDAERRVKALKSRNRTGDGSASYGEFIPLDSELIVDWSISRIEQWGRKNGMELFKEEEDKNGRMTIMLGGKVLVIDVDLAIQRDTANPAARRISVTNIKTSHALPSGNSGNALAERSASLDAFILRTWNNYLEEVQKNDVDSSIRAAYISRDIEDHLSYLMKLDALASREGDQGIRWFNDTGIMSAIADRIFKTEADSLSQMLQTPVVNLDVFLSRAHALAIPYLVSPTMSFLVYLSPLACYTLIRAAEKGDANFDASRHDTSGTYMKLDIPLSILRKQLTHRRLRPAGATIATLILASVSSSLSLPEWRPDQRPNVGRPYFRLPGASGLSALDHNLIAPSNFPFQDPEGSSKNTRNAWMLDFTDGGHSPGIVMTHSRLREIQQVVDPVNLGGGMGFPMQTQPLPGSWIRLLINPTLPPSERYIAIYNSPSEAHPPLRLRLTAPNEAGFLLQCVPVTCLKQIYGILEIVRDQCWINETLKTIDWVAEDLMPDVEGDEDDMDTAGAPEEDLETLLEGTFTPRRIPVNVFLPIHPPSFPSNGGADAADGLGLDAEHAVPGLTSVSGPAGVISPSPCIALAFAVHVSRYANAGHESGFANGPRQVALVVKHDRTRRRGVRVDVNISAASEMGYSASIGERPSPALIDELEEIVRRGGAFGAAGKVWTWLTGKI